MTQSCIISSHLQLWKHLKSYNTRKYNTRQMPFLLFPVSTLLFGSLIASCIYQKKTKKKQNRATGKQSRATVFFAPHFAVCELFWCLWGTVCTTEPSFLNERRSCQKFNTAPIYSLAIPFKERTVIQWGAFPTHVPRNHRNLPHDKQPPSLFCPHH